MPYDGDIAEWEVAKVTPDTPSWIIRLFRRAPKPGTLRWLAYLLRHKELWPEGFQWDFKCVTSCAVGLTWAALYRRPVPHGLLLWATVQSLYHMNAMDAFAVFTGGGREVTPEDVAKRIDQYLRSHYNG